MSLFNRNTHVVVDELGMDPLRDQSYEKIIKASTQQIYVVTEADQYNLPLIAHKVYGDVKLWWVILVFNAISDAFRVTAGTELRIPNINDIVSELSTKEFKPRFVEF